MTSAGDWQCGDCRTLSEGPETRKYPNCGGINIYPLTDEVPGDGHDGGTIESDITLGEALEHLPTEVS